VCAHSMRNNNQNFAWWSN